MQYPLSFKYCILVTYKILFVYHETFHTISTYMLGMKYFNKVKHKHIYARQNRFVKYNLHGPIKAHTITFKHFI